MAQIIAIPDKSQAVGTWGELHVIQELQKIGWRAERQAEHYVGDVRAVTKDSEVLKIEVKTARLGRDRRYHFNLKAEGKTDCAHADFVVLIAINKYGNVSSTFIIPAYVLENVSHLSMTNPASNNGKYSHFRRSITSFPRYLDQIARIR